MSTGPDPVEPAPVEPAPVDAAHAGASAPGSGRSASGFGPDAVATPANLLSVFRLLAAPVLFAMILDTVATWPNWAIWTVLALTDGVDGVIARRYGTTRSGAFLDPLADKVLVLGAMFSLVAAGVFAIFPVVLIALRELVISVFRVHLVRHGLAVPARQSAKVKTVLQGLAVGAALMPWLAPHAWLADGLLWASVFVAGFSGYQYLRDGRRAATTMS